MICKAPQQRPDSFTRYSQLFADRGLHRRSQVEASSDLPYLRSISQPKYVDEPPPLHLITFKDPFWTLGIPLMHHSWACHRQLPMNLDLRNSPYSWQLVPLIVHVVLTCLTIPGILIRTSLDPAVTHSLSRPPLRHSQRHPSALYRLVCPSMPVLAVVVMNTVVQFNDFAAQRSQRRECVEICFHCSTLDCMLFRQTQFHARR